MRNDPDHSPAEEERAMGTPGGGAEGQVTVRRTATGWRVSGPPPPNGDGPENTADDLLSAIVLADLLCAEQAATDVAPGARPPRVTDDLDELARLRIAVQQLEHALAARVLVEQAIGVLAEREHTPPRQAFEHLRRVARSHGQKVHVLAAQVVASVTDPSVVLPGGLPGNRT
jgi:hypothetical protein